MIAAPYLVLVWLYAPHKIWVGSVSTKGEGSTWLMNNLHGSGTNQRQQEEIHVDSVMHSLGGLPLHLFNELHEGKLELGRHR